MSNIRPRQPHKAKKTRSDPRRQKQADKQASRSLSHQECDSLLEFYISSEIRGENAAKLYPTVARHLLTCERCRTSYSLVKDALSFKGAEKDARASQTAFSPLPFLSTPQPTEAWKRVVRSPIGGAPIGFGFAIQRQHLLASISPSTGLSVRGASPSSEAPLLLSDTVVLGQRQVMVEMRTMQSQDPDHIEVRISLAASSPLPAPVHATLEWNQEQRSAIVQDGKCSFEGIPVSAVAEGGEIHVEFSAGEETDQAK